MKNFGIAAAMIAALAVAGCQTVGEAIVKADVAVTKAQVAVKKYAPIVGNTLLKIGDIIVTAECSQAQQQVSGASIKILNIVAPTNDTANRVSDALQTNMQITQQVCPLVAQIQTAVGYVPAGTPAQVITLPAGS